MKGRLFLEIQNGMHPIYGLTDQLSVPGQTVYAVDLTLSGGGGDGVSIAKQNN